MRKIVIDPRVIKHLGRDLITSPEVAIIELIKNSIDAKASHINLRLYNSISEEEKSSVAVSPETVWRTTSSRRIYPAACKRIRFSSLSAPTPKLFSA